MADKHYVVYMGSEKVASGLTLEHATILLSALFSKYDNEHTMVSMTEDTEPYYWSKARR